MSHRSTPERIDAARHAAVRARLVASGMTEETADAWIAAWASLAARDGRPRKAAYWDAAWTWIGAEREHRPKP
jgi:hypothetical protein